MTGLWAWLGVADLEFSNVHAVLDDARRLRPTTVRVTMNVPAHHWPNREEPTMDRYTDFFMWASEAQQTTQVEVTSDLIAEYRATILPPDPSPPIGRYTVIGAHGEARKAA